MNLSELTDQELDYFGEVIAREEGESWRESARFKHYQDEQLRRDPNMIEVVPGVFQVRREWESKSQEQRDKHIAWLENLYN